MNQLNDIFVNIRINRLYMRKGILSNEQFSTTKNCLLLLDKLHKHFNLVIEFILEMNQLNGESN